MNKFKTDKGRQVVFGVHPEHGTLTCLGELKRDKNQTAETALREWVNTSTLVEGGICRGCDHRHRPLQGHCSQSGRHRGCHREPGRMSDSRVEIDVEKIRATEAAILVRDADDNQIWLPLSQVEILEQNFAGDQVKLSIPEWVAIEKGLV